MSMSLRFAALFSALLLFAPMPALADATTGVASDPPIRKLNGILVDAKGRGLYTYDDDKRPGFSDCSAQCRLLWPPIFADDDAQPKGPFTIALRDDGRKQWALKGKPLYRWASDKRRGDAGGDGVNGKWRLVRTSKPAATP